MLLHMLFFRESLCEHAKKLCEIACTCMFMHIHMYMYMHGLQYVHVHTCTCVVNLKVPNLLHTRLANDYVSAKRKLSEYH